MKPTGAAVAAGARGRESDRAPLRDAGPTADQLRAKTARFAPVDLTAEEHRERGIETFNATWTFIGMPERGPEDDEAMIRTAYASAYHWSHAARREPVNDARGEWLLARVHTLASRPEGALLHAERCAAIVEADGIGDFDLAYAHEAKARKILERVA